MITIMIKIKSSHTQDSQELVSSIKLGRLCSIILKSNLFNRLIYFRLYLKRFRLEWKRFKSRFYLCGHETNHIAFSSTIADIREELSSAKFNMLSAMPEFRELLILVEVYTGKTMGP